MIVALGCYVLAHRGELIASMVASIRIPARTTTRRSALASDTARPPSTPEAHPVPGNVRCGGSAWIRLSDRNACSILEPTLQVSRASLQLLGTQLDTQLFELRDQLRVSGEFLLSCDSASRDVALELEHDLVGLDRSFVVAHRPVVLGDPPMELHGVEIFLVPLVGSGIARVASKLTMSCTIGAGLRVCLDHVPAVDADPIRPGRASVDSFRP